VVYSDPYLAREADDFIDSQRDLVTSTGPLIQRKVETAIRHVTVSPEQRLAAQADDTPLIEVLITNQRDTAAEVLTPGSNALLEIAQLQGYQAAGVQNAAVIAAAGQSEDQLDKVWIATLDGKTRDTHFAADGQRAPLDGTFAVGVAALHFPGDPAGPPAEVKNCRCRVGVLAEDEKTPDEVDRHTERLGGRDSVQVNRQGSQRDEIERRERRGVVRAREDEDGIGRTAAGGWTAPSEQGYDMKKTPAQLAAEAAARKATLASENDDSTETYRTFTDQPIAFVGIETSDGRMLAKDIDLKFRTFPQPVMWTKQTGMGHMDAFTVGVFESATIDGDKVLGSGYLLNTPEADEAAEQLAHTATRPSVDLAATEWILTDENGKEISEEEWYDLPPDAKVIQTIIAAELIGATLVATPAFGETMLSLNAERETRDAALVASAVFTPRSYAAELFDDPHLSGPTALQIDEATGRVFGHLACFGQCHRSVQANCIVAPRSPSNYAMFHTSPPVRLDNGNRIPVGRLTVGTGHAPDELNGGPAMAHYDNTGTAWALVRAGEDAHGVWVSGVVAPWATPEQVEMALASPLSGDWRNFGQGLDLVAGLNVNTPGFVVRGRDDDNGRPAALVASIAPHGDEEAESNRTEITDESLAAIVEAAVGKALSARETQAEAERLLALAAETVGLPPAPKTPNEEVAELLAEVD
jgi:hypothetical protein